MTLRSEEEIAANLRRIAREQMYRGTCWQAKLLVFKEWWKPLVGDTELWRG